MLRINGKNIWHDRDSNPEPTPWERCCPNHTAVIYFWIKRVGSFGQIKKEKRPYWMNNFSCILHILRKITIGETQTESNKTEVTEPTAYVAMETTEELAPRFHKVHKAAAPCPRTITVSSPQARQRLETQSTRTIMISWLS